MAPLDEKHVSFEEPLLVSIVDMDPENVEPPIDRKRTRYLALGLLAMAFVGILVQGPAGTRASLVLSFKGLILPSSSRRHISK